jgi:bacteriocin biosynthesis cyclodehydratase domain-containing protein
MNVNERLELHPSVEYVVLPEDRIQIRGVNDKITFDSHFDILISLLKLMEGHQPLNDIREHLCGLEGSDELSDIIAFLERKGFLIRKPSDSNRAIEIDLHVSHLDFLRTQNAWHCPKDQNIYETLLFTNHPVIVVGQGSVFEAACSSLSAIDFELMENPDDWDQYPGHLVVACSDFESSQYFCELNRMAVAQRLTILFAHLDEHRIKIGPIVIPYQTACYDCHIERSKLSLVHPAEHEAYARKCDQKRREGARISSPLLSMLFGYHIADRILRYTGGLVNSTRMSEILVLDTLDNSVETSRVIKIPRCKTCGLNWVSRPTQAIRDLI